MAAEIEIKQTETKKSERKYYTFDKKTFDNFIRSVIDLRTYVLRGPKLDTITDIYYDNDKFLLEENDFLLRKRVMGSKAIIKIKRRYFDPLYQYSDILRSGERKKEVKSTDPLSKHFFFLNNALNSMYSASLRFDPDKLFEQVKPTIVITIKQKRYEVVGQGGLRVEIICQDLLVKNFITKRKNKTQLISVSRKSDDSTQEAFETMITRMEKHCKEILPTKDNKYEIARRITKKLPSRLERKMAREEAILRRKREEGDA